MQLSPSEIKALTYEDYPVNIYGSIERAITELSRDGHLFVLLCIETGFLFESYLADNGTTWSSATASRFNTYNGPAVLHNLLDKWIFMVWNNSSNSPHVFSSRKR